MIGLIIAGILFFGMIGLAVSGVIYFLVIEPRLHNENIKWMFERRYSDKISYGERNNSDEKIRYK